MIVRKHKTLVASAFAAFAMFASSPASAAEVIVDFEFGDGIDTVTGSFTYDNSVTGLIGYGDLDAFDINVGGQTYDLNYVLTAPKMNKHHFSYDPLSQSFISAKVSGVATYISALNKNYDSGFFIRDNSSGSLGDVSRGGGINFSASTVTVSAIPAPATWMMTLLGFAAMGLVLRRRPTGDLRMRTQNANELPGAYD